MQLPVLGPEILAGLLYALYADGFSGRFHVDASCFDEPAVLCQVGRQAFGIPGREIREAYHVA